MKNMKRILCVLLAVMTLCGVVGVAASAAPIQSAGIIDTQIANFFKELEKILQLENLTEQQLKPLIAVIGILKALGVDVESLIKNSNIEIPITVKAMLYKYAGINFPIYERSYFWHYFFKFVLFGWIWM